MAPGKEEEARTTTRSPFTSPNSSNHRSICTAQSGSVAQRLALRSPCVVVVTLHSSPISPLW